MRLFFKLLLLILLIIADSVAAEGPESFKTLTECESSVVDVKNRYGRELGIAGLGDEIVIMISSPSCLFKAAENDKKKIVLFINSQELTGIPMSSYLVDKGAAELHFSLRRTESSKKAWAQLLGIKRSSDMKLKKEVKASVGLEGGYPLPVKDNNLKLVIIRGGRLLVSIIILTAAFFLFVFGSKHVPVLRDLLRDSGPDPVGGSRRPYSLGRIQMAWWTVIILGSFLGIWIITGEYDSLTGTALLLMGISSGTALGATVMDSRAENKIINKTLQSKDLLSDILTDDNGAALHRLQMLIWTLVLGIIYIVEVVGTLSMPEFNNTLLALMGISSGVYLGFKFPEKQTPDTSAKQ